MPPTLAIGSVSGALHAGIRMREGDILLKKPRYGAFHGTHLELMLRQRGIDTLISGGIATKVCCETMCSVSRVRAGLRRVIPAALASKLATQKELDSTMPRHFE